MQDSKRRISPPKIAIGRLKNRPMLTSYKQQAAVSAAHTYHIQIIYSPIHLQFEQTFLGGIMTLASRILVPSNCRVAIAIRALTLFKHDC